MATLEAVGELAFIEAIAEIARDRRRARGVTVGIGDDAAVLVCSRATIVTTDTQREGVHFRRDWLTPRALGRRAFRIAVSDVAAMGGVARYVLLSFGAPGSLDAAWARGIVTGLVHDARACGAALVGGNVSRDDAISLVVTVVGDAAAPPVLRSGARSGDRIWVTGALGAASAGVERLERGERRGTLVAAYRTPPLRLDVARDLARRRLATAMIDVSDGLLHDLAHVCRASSLSARVDVAAVPIARGLARAASLERKPLEYALDGGDDYEIVFTTAPSRRTEHAVIATCEARGCMVRAIGTMERTGRIPRVRDLEGRPLAVRGYVHFGDDREA